MDSSPSHLIPKKDLKPKKSFISSFMSSPLTLPSSSFKEDTYHHHTLKPSEHKSLQQFRDLLTQEDHSSTSIWGIPLLPETPKSDVVLLKFLRARDFKVQDSYQMLTNCLSWRKEFRADTILEEDLIQEDEGFKELEGVVAYMNGFDREGHPVCYNAYGVFKNQEMYERFFGDDDKLQRFLRWRVQVLERGIKMLHFKPGGINSIIQVTDLKDMPKRELRVASNHILSLFQDNYPEMVACKVNCCWLLGFSFFFFFENFGFLCFGELYCTTRQKGIFFFGCLGGWSWESVFDFLENDIHQYTMVLQHVVFNHQPIYDSRTKSKFVISKEGNVAETLYKYIRPEDIPVQYGGLSRPSELNNGPAKPASEFTVKGGEKVNIQIEGIEAGATITWDVVVGGWDLEYCAEFVPNATTSYTIAVEKPRKMIATDEAVNNSFTAKEAGKLVLCINNTASRKRKVAAYRYLVRKSMVTCLKMKHMFTLGDDYNKGKESYLIKVEQ
ncbi:hypothetical protein OSB04_021409 [Centaurea solstitialis]|uniref:GOLD domain-containing protein n=1 Tax=Centaurea solstitialis TaxID=347529 RepID=A0AA38T7J2_9ASTR|nr:hypothetical protein OSB04_021409 [Centaurea solstitialis]